MRRVFIFFMALLVVLVHNCTSHNKPTISLACIDIRKTYPEKEIMLNDIADVTFVHLNSNNENYLYKGVISYATNNTIIVYDNSSGSILLFSKEGNPKSRFNRLGQGPEEYLGATRIIYYEDTDDVLVGYMYSDYIQVYSSTGEYKRTINLPIYTEILSINYFDNESFYVYAAEFSRIQTIIKNKQLKAKNVNNSTRNYTAFFRISIIDGTVMDYIELPSNEINLITENDRGQIMLFYIARLNKCADGLLLCNPETDTVYLYSKDKLLVPVLHKLPLIHNSDPVAYLNNYLDTSWFQFMQVVFLSWGNVSYPNKFYVRDKKTGEVFRQKNILREFISKEFTIHNSSRYSHCYENGAIFELELIELKQALKENKLSGKLKELVVTLNEFEDNNVFMFVEFK